MKQGIHATVRWRAPEPHGLASRLHTTDGRTSKCQPITLLVVVGCLSLVWSPADPAAADDPKDLSLTAARAMDSNKDGQISKAEFFARSDDTALWTKLDANADGVLDAEEQKQGIRVQPVTAN